ncbi:hypothetical protein [Planktothrix mougeotii]|uniref:Uncharacterized protein n=1 Tax=Planktothrix mougeotii LEGE 06226 TaxID=1828728 RepID=A0ABR9U655_9CYAN|nr:hypothetical protein [Planktothrix mougeotii]MBE9141920.1 hypothetical protein [Planktothrix mougeotii LEGE 06226]
MKAYTDKGELTQIGSPNRWVILGLGTALFIISMSLIYSLVSKDGLLFIGFFTFLVVSFIMIVIYIAWAAILNLKKTQITDQINRQLAGDFISNPDNYWYHWKYTERDRQWIASHIFLEGLGILLLWSPFIIIFILIIEVINGRKFHYHPTGNWLQDVINLLGVELCIGFGIGLVCFIGGIFQAAKRSKNICDVYIGENGFYADGEYWCWEGTPYHLYGINLSKRVLKFELFYQLLVQESEQDQDFVLNTRLFADEPTGEITRSIFVPLGQEQAAGQIVQELAPKCIPRPRRRSSYYDSSTDYYSSGDSYDSSYSDSDNSCSWGDSGDSGDSCSSGD